MEQFSAFVWNVGKRLFNIPRYTSCKTLVGSHCPVDLITESFELCSAAGQAITEQSSSMGLFRHIDNGPELCLGGKEIKFETKFVDNATECEAISCLLISEMRSHERRRNQRRGRRTTVKISTDADGYIRVPRMQETTDEISKYYHDWKESLGGSTFDINMQNVTAGSSPTPTRTDERVTEPDITTTASKTSTSMLPMQAATVEMKMTMDFESSVDSHHPSPHPSPDMMTLEQKY